MSTYYVMICLRGGSVSDTQCMFVFLCVGVYVSVYVVLPRYPDERLTRLRCLSPADTKIKSKCWHLNGPTTLTCSQGQERL